jgi:hypothetical protein
MTRDWVSWPAAGGDHAYTSCCHYVLKVTSSQWVVDNSVTNTRELVVDVTNVIFAAKV